MTGMPKVFALVAALLRRLAPYRKAIVAAVGAILTAVAPLLPVNSTAAQVIATVLAVGTTLGVWAVPNRPAARPTPATVTPITSTTTGGGTTPAA